MSEISYHRRGKKKKKRKKYNYLDKISSLKYRETHRWLRYIFPQTSFSTTWLVRGKPEFLEARLEIRLGYPNRTSKLNVLHALGRKSVAAPRDRQKKSVHGVRRERGTEGL